MLGMLLAIQAFMRILIAEDERDQREALTDFLVSMGNCVVAVEDGEAAARELESGNYDLAIMDVRLRGRDGLSVLKELRRRNSNTPVILMSTFITEADFRKHSENGANASLSKPYCIDELFATMTKAVRA